MKRGSSSVADLFLGSLPVNKIYRGASLEWARPLAIEYLVVAGGGGGGRWWTYDPHYVAGGGAGGYRSSVQGELSGRNSSPEPQKNLTPGSYVVTIGAGGTYGSSGTDSVFDNVTSIGGGSGAWNSVTTYTGRSGGSGGGGANTGGGGGGTTGQGFQGSAGTGITNPGVGGGAGAAGVGANTGGSGISSLINGTATYRAGGGGSTAGGLGGGGAAGGSGAANTGGGGGGRYGSGDTNNGGSGGSGVVIIRYPGSVAKATGGSITYAGGYVIHTFTSSGAFVIT